MDMQDVSNLVIPEGEVKTIHDKNSRLLWSKVNYDTEYKGDATQQTYSGKNLEDFSTISFSGANGGSGTRNGPTYTVVGASNGGWGGVGFRQSALQLEPSTTYTLSATVQSTTNQSGSAVYIGKYMSSTDAYILGNNAKAGERSIATFTTPASIPGYDAELRLLPRAASATAVFTDIQIEKGSTATSYEPYVGGTASPNPDYPQAVNVVTGTQTITISDGTNSHNYTVNLGSIELCKIGTYQDYIYKSGDDWYVHKSVGKTTYSGGSGESWNLFGNGSGFFIANSEVLAPLTATDVGTMAVKSQYYLSCDFNSIYNSLVNYGIALYGATSPRNRVCVRNKDISTAADFKTWLSTHNMTVYYALATPTDTKITDNTLIGELETVNEWLIRYGYSGTASTSSPNALPIIIIRNNL